MNRLYLLNLVSDRPCWIPMQRRMSSERERGENAGFEDIEWLRPSPAMIGQKRNFASLSEKRVTGLRNHA